MWNSKILNDKFKKDFFLRLNKVEIKKNKKKGITAEENNKIHLRRVLSEEELEEREITRLAWPLEEQFMRDNQHTGFAIQDYNAIRARVREEYYRNKKNN